MANLNYRKTLGAALCAFYGTLSLAGIYQFISNKYGLYNPVISPLIWILQDIICCGAMYFIAFNKSIKPHKLSRIGAEIIATIFGIFAINIALSFAKINIFSVLGVYFGIILSSIEVISAGLLFYFIKSWLPVRLSAFFYWIPTLFSSVYLSKIKRAAELAEKTQDWTHFEEIWSANQTCEFIMLILSIVTVIVTLVWMAKEPITQHSKSNNLDII